MSRFQDYSDELNEIAYLLGDDHNAEAVRLLRVYLKNFPDDMNALYMLANGLECLGQYQESLEIANNLVAQQPDHYSALAVIARCLQSLGKREEAQALIESWLMAYAGTSTREKAMRQPGMSYRYWRLLMDKQDYEAALRVAHEHGNTDGFWRSCFVDTLIALERCEEAEALYSREPADQLQGLWDIGFTLVFAEKYSKALDYFRRVLSFIQMPGDFDYLFAYLECLYLVGDYPEVEVLCLHWLSKIALRPLYRVRDLQALLALTYDKIGNVKAAREYALLCCKAGDSEKCYHRYFLREMHFEETSDAMRTTFTSLLHIQDAGQ